MAHIELLPIEGGQAVVIPSAKTTVGRGPFLEIADKRVSRNHATLEIQEDKLVLTPIHTNPCFFRAGGESPQITLEKDKPKTLHHNDVIGLLPDKLFFRVIYRNLKKQKKIKEEQQSLENGGTEKDEETKPSVALVRKKAIALPLEKKRILPSWMKGTAKRTLHTVSPSSSKSPARAVADNIHTPVKKAVGRAKAGGRQAVEESRTPGRRPRAASLKSPKYNDDEYAVSGVDLGLSSGSEDHLKHASSEDDSDFDAKNDSDWDKPTRKTKGRGVKGSAKGRGRGKKRQRRVNSYEESEEESSEEEYKKKPTRRRSRQNSNRLDSDEEVGRSPRRKSRRKLSESEEEDSDGEKKYVKRTRGKRKLDSHRDMCQYGVDCYRKNPAHFEEFCHPGDSSWDSDEAATNRKQTRPKRNAARPKDKKSVLQGTSDDEGLANTYDYEDSFLDNQGQSSESSFSNPESDSEWEPDLDSGEDIKGLVREAKGFVRNKKMARPLRNK